MQVLYVYMTSSIFSAEINWLSNKQKKQIKNVNVNNNFMLLIIYNNTKKNKFQKLSACHMLTLCK